MSLFYCYLDSPVGPFLLAGDKQKLHYTAFSTGHKQQQPADDWTLDRKPLHEACEQFEAYFAGDQKTFDLQFILAGTPFQEKVWMALGTIPYGETRSYGDIAKQIGQPGASRAVGMANNANHLPIIIPCHRVIGADGSMTGFGGGVKTKTRLLSLEGSDAINPQLALF